MDENLNYQDQDDFDEDRGFDSSEWQMEHVSFLGREESDMLLQYKNYHLHFIRKKEPPTYRRMIPSTKIERLAFYRNYICSPNKAMRKYFEVKGFLWYYLLNVFFKTLPHTYVNVFMASYAPEQHSFLVLMSPCFHGAKFILILSALLELINFSKNMVLLLDYILRGIIYKNPWNRCSLKLPGTESFNYTCCTITEMAEKVINKNVTLEEIQEITFNVVDGERYILVQVEYFIKRFHHMRGLTDRFFFFVIWIMVAIMAHKIFKRRFWKLLNITQSMILILFLMAYIHITFSYVQKHEEMLHKNITVTAYSTAVFNDVDALLDVTVAPPIIHILTARSVQEIFPNGDSALIVLSNTLFYIFRGLLTHQLQMHCELLTNSPLTTKYNYLCWYFLWPIYLNSFFLGDLFTIFYFTLNFIVEFCSFMIAFQCLVEFMSVEWMNLNRLFLTVGLTSVGIIFYAALTVDFDCVCMYSKLTMNFIECFIINFMYPLPRLIDDMTFHYGIPPPKLRVFSMRLVVFIAMIIFYVCILCLIADHEGDAVEDLEEEYVILFIFFFILVIGFFYTVVKYLVRKKVAFRNIFVPVETWGPNDYHLRQLRKQYDSRFYIGSQAPRALSRYLMSKAEAKRYYLDLRYDSDRRSTIATTDYRKENDRKSI